MDKIVEFAAESVAVRERQNQDGVDVQKVGEFLNKKA